MNQTRSGAMDEAFLRQQQDEEYQELHRQLKEKDQVFENYKKTQGALKVYISTVTGAVEPIQPLTLVYKPQSRRSKKRVSACMQTTDSHMGAVQNADEIEGLNQFDPTICRRRNMGFAVSALKYVDALRSAYTINTLHWFFTGDLISGDIHQELLTTNAFPSPVQVVQAAMIGARQVAQTAPHYERVVIHFIAADNHARLTKKPQAAEAGINSLNYLVGTLMQEYLRKHTNVEFNLYPVTEKVVRVENYNYLVMHGHTVKSWMGVPYYGLERKVGKESTVRLAAIMREQNEMVMKRAREIGFNKMMHGHYHVKFNGEMMRCAASVQGTTALDHNAGRFAEPSQPCWLVHPEHGEFANTDFRLRAFDGADWLD